MRPRECSSLFISAILIAALDGHLGQSRFERAGDSQALPRIVRRPAEPMASRMNWRFYEALVHRPAAVWQSGGISRLLPVGEMLRWTDKHARVRRSISQSVLYVSQDLDQNAAQCSEAEAAALASLWEIITRSELCPVDPVVDEYVRCEVQRRLGVQAQGITPERARELTSEWCLQRRVQAVSSPLRRFDDEPTGARRERVAWLMLQTAFDGRLAPWAHPQPLFETLGVAPDGFDERRPDFVVAPPWSEPLVWEVHGELDANDRFKSGTLRQAGFDVFDQRVGSDDDQVPQELERLLGRDPGRRLEDWELWLLDAGWLSSQIDLTVAWLLSRLPRRARAETWTIMVPERLVGVAQAAAESVLAIVRASFAIWSVAGECATTPSLRVTAITDEIPTGLVIQIDPDGATYLEADEKLRPATCLVRRACFARDVIEHPRPSAGPRSHVRPVDPPQAEPLRLIMRRIFDKPDFRAGQLEGVRQALTGQDSLILLPTGHGKSLIFQLAAFLLPGMTLVVEPFRSLIDDQARNLQDLGISRVLAVHSGRDRSAEAVARGLASAAIAYVAAERLHVKSFVQSLTQTASRRGLDLFVVDEAHTVSQFGHSFRPAYLDLFERINGISCSAGCHRPTTVALTATAAQRVLRDIQALLQISGDPISLAETHRQAFVRPNLEDEIVWLDWDAIARSARSKEEGEKVSSELQTALEASLRSSLGAAPDGQGIVFCPSKGDLKPRVAIPPDWTVIHSSFGARGILRLLAGIREQGERLGLYTGGSEDDTTDAREQMLRDASAFSKGDIPVMVATSAFGTGVDLQGVNWTIHVGMPGGIEAYYQEMGRAGRSGARARCWLLVDPDGAELEDALAIAGDVDDPISEIQARLAALRTKKGGELVRRGSLSRQLGLLLGNGVSAAEGSIEQPVTHAAADGSVRVVFKPSFPGRKWESRAVDKQVIAQVLGIQRGDSGVVRCHTWWQDLVWKSVHRLAALGVVRHGFQHEMRQTEGLIDFSVERCDDESILEADTLARAVRRLLATAGEERASHAEKTLLAAMDGKDEAGRLTLASAMLLKHVYRIVYETRVESLRSLLRYARQPDLDARRQLVEDYFAPSEFKRLILKLCTREFSKEVVEEALSLARGEARWRNAVFESAATEYPGATLPLLLLAIGGVRRNDASEASRYLLAIVSKPELSIDLRLHCFDEVLAEAGSRGLAEQTLDSLGELLADGDCRALFEVLLRRLDDGDGKTALAHRLVTAFLTQSEREAE